MIRTSISLSNLMRLGLPIKRRGHSFAKILNIRRGSKISRIFTYIFSHSATKKLFGANIAFAIVAAGFLPVRTTINEAADINVIAAQNVVTKTEKGTQYPVNNVVINTPYRIFHPGLDFEGKTGDPVKPIMAGKVENVQYSRFAYGNAIIVDHGDGLTSLYAHLSKINVKEGVDVNKTTEIGKVGSTGRSTGDHLHLEVRQNDKPINPMAILPKN